MFEVDMQVMRGPLAHSHFRIERLLTQISAKVPQVNTLQAEFIHLLDLKHPLIAEEESIVSNLLSYGTYSNDIKPDLFQGLTLIVTLQPGQFSAWSDKATELFHECTLTAVNRVERGIVYYIEANEKITWGDKQAIISVLCERETEAVFYHLEELDSLFEKTVLEKSESLPLSSMPFDAKAILNNWNLPHLRIPGFVQAWEDPAETEEINLNALQILLTRGLQMAQSNNEAGRPVVGGYLRTYFQSMHDVHHQRIHFGYTAPLTQTIALTETGDLFSELSTNPDLYCSFSKKKSINEIQETVEPTRPLCSLSLSQKTLEETIFRLLRTPAIADKSYLINISDRSATALIAQDAMVGPWQVPVADCVVLLSDFDSHHGEALALGERSPISIIDPLAAARLAVGEALTNIASADISTLSDISLWVDCAFSFSPEMNKKIDRVFNALQETLCPSLGVSVYCQKNPLMLKNMPATFSVTARGKVNDVRRTLTPVLALNYAETALIYLDLSGGYQRLGQSLFAEVYHQTGDSVPDLADGTLLKSFSHVFQQLRVEGKILAFHDRSDGGLLVTLCEMAFASHIGIQVDVSELGRNIRSILFNEELGAVIQVRAEDVESVLAEFLEAGVASGYLIGGLDKGDRVSVVFNEEVVFVQDRIILQQAWSETSLYLQAMRDNPRCAKKQFDAIADRNDPGLKADLSFDPNEDITAPYIQTTHKPKVAILREQGCSGHHEMAGAFNKARFECVDVNMQDLKSEKINLNDFIGMAVCGGFSFGDVLGAGQGWAKKILFNRQLSDQFEAFFKRENTFTAGFSNGCQMLSGLRSLIPGAELWPTFTQNYSEQFESRWCLVEVQKSVSPFLKSMEGTLLPVPVAHQEGRVEFDSEEIQEEALKRGLVTLRYVDSRGRKTKTYPANPNGSPLGITGLTTRDGRVLIMMPHPERAFRAVQYPWRPLDWTEDGPWLRVFREMRTWVG
jgi:phosphoribosylformylglycinamidine synthase single chain form